MTDQFGKLMYDTDKHTSKKLFQPEALHLSLFQTVKSGDSPKDSALVTEQ